MFQRRIRREGSTRRFSELVNVLESGRLPGGEVASQGIGRASTLIYVYEYLQIVLIQGGKAESQIESCIFANPWVA